VHTNTGAWRNCLSIYSDDYELRQYNRVFTGCRSLNELHSAWRYSPTAASMVQHPTTYPDNCSESLMSACGGDFVPRRLLHWSFHGLFEPPSATGLSLLQRLQFGTAFRKHLWPCSESHWKRHFSRDPALTNVLTNCTNMWRLHLLFRDLEVFGLSHVNVSSSCHEVHNPC